MNKLVAIVLLVLAGLYATGRMKLGESGAMKYLMHTEDLMNAGQAGDICERVHDDLEFTVADHTAKPPRNIEGGKPEMCDLTHDAVEALGKIPHDTHVRWDDVEVKRDWLHPWTSEISYTEDRTLSIAGANVQISTTSENTMTLVYGLSGVKLRKLASEVWVAQ